MGRLKDIISLYDSLLFSKLIKGESADYPRMGEKEDAIGVNFLGTSASGLLSTYYVIDNLPRELPVNWIEILRSKCEGDTRLNIITDYGRHSIAWDSQQMKARLRIMHDSSERRAQEDINAYNLHQNINALTRQRWVEDSLMYLSVADRERGCGLYRVCFLLILTGTPGDYYDASVRAFETEAKSMSLRLQRVLFDIPDILRTFSPFSHDRSTAVNRDLPHFVMTDETMARFTAYTQGVLGRSGIYFGTDIYSHFPVLKEVKREDVSAENWLVTAETGGGKSFFVKLLLLQLLGKGFNGTIMDVEGFEYIPMANFLSHSSKVRILNMAEGEGCYFDPVEIMPLTGIATLDKDAKQMSVNFTLSVLKTLLGRVYTDNLMVALVLDDAVSESYKDYGVNDDPETWGNSSGMTLHTIYETLGRLEHFRSGDEYSEAVRLCQVGLTRYFDEGGTRTSLFKNRVPVSDIAEADLVLCSFGMAGKSQQAIDEVQLSLMQLSAAQISHQRSIFSKARGRYNFKVWEEFQRWGKFPDSDKTIGVALTGGRKLGDVNIIITNVLKELLDDDRFGIFSNITSFLVGAIGDEQVRHEFCQRVSLPLMKKELDLLAQASAVSKDVQAGSVDNVKASSPFHRGFLCGLDRSLYSLVRADVPPSIAASKLFKTGVS